MYDDPFFLEGTPLGVGLLTELNQLGYEPVRSNYPYINYGSISPRFSTPNRFAVPLGPFHTHAINADLQKVYGKHTIGRSRLSRLPFPQF
jgi:hypothetical protein